LPAATTLGGATAVSVSGTQTLTNKTLTNPAINGFTGDTSVINIGSGQLYKDASGNVGIGINTPLERLHVATGDGLSTSNAFLRLGNSSAFNTLLLGYSGSGDVTDEAPAIYATSSLGSTGVAGHIAYKARSGSTVRDHIFYTGATPTERMRIDSTGNVGIGTSSPSARLDVVGNAAGTLRVAVADGNAQLRLERTGSGSGHAFLGASSVATLHVFNSAFAEQMRIDSAGNVGIGTSSPAAPIDVVAGSGSTAVNIRGRSSDNAGSLYFTSNASAATEYGFLGGRPTDVRLYTIGSNPLLLGTNGAEKMRIDSAGNVGIGTSTPQDALDITAASGTASIRIASQGVGSLTWRLASQLVGVANAGFVIRDETNTVNRLVIDGSGNVGIGTSSPTFKLEVAGNIYIKADTRVKSVYPIVDNVYDVGTASFRFDDIFATNGTIQTSDRNEKQDIEELSEAEQRVAVAAKALMRKFRWKSAVEEKGDDARIHFGIIAQDLKAAFEAEGLDTGRYAMFIHSTWTDEETGEERSRMGIRYSELLAFIIAAI
jgi:hypothetical protein